MKLNAKTVDILFLVIALGWIVGMVMTYLGYGFAAMYITIPIISAHFLIGLASNGEINKKLFMYPFLAWLITFTIGIIGMLSTTPADLTVVPKPILGMHPSFFFEIVFYWLSGIATISLGIYLYRDLWLPKDKWDAFVKEMTEGGESTDE